MRPYVLLLTPLLLAAADPAAWTKWRGPNETGVAHGTAPTHWSNTKNVAWKAQIPGRGHSSPVLWGDLLFLTTAVPTAPMPGESGSDSGGGRGAGGGFASGIPHRFVVMALDRKTGKPVWEKTLLTATPHEGYHFRYGSFASNSPVTDGKLVYAFFGSRGIYALDLKGNLVWKKTFGSMRMRLGFGEGVPTVLDGDRLLLNFDQEDGSYLLALDKTTGKEIWKVEREEPSSWSPPAVTEVAGKKQIIIAASNKVRAYDYETGKVIWQCGGLGTNVIPAPVIYNDTVIVMSGHRDPNRMAIKLGRTGDLTGTDAIVWQNTKGNSYTASPVLHDGAFYFVTDNGILSSLDAATGELHYQVRLPGTYSLKASPVAANGNLYISTEQGDVVVVKMGKTFEVVATNKMDDEFFIATPAIAGGELFLRGRNTLYCIR
ncbi:MAG TPA: PQQ-binding-like beta-propeller repeat protein [Bryobacteraceae bacterium]|nr:PQQ-binding-like beta-propeller repeat protein [Bryobacteraceae bacterium]